MPKWRWATGRIPLIQERSRQWIVWRWVVGAIAIALLVLVMGEASWLSASRSTD
jgi:hypothetical protein